MSRQRPPCRRRRHDDGFTLVEMLIVVVVVGILATITVFAVRGITDRGEAASCATDSKTLAQAADMYLGEYQVDVIPPTGADTDGDRYERTLVDAGVIEEVSTLHDMSADGSLVVSGDVCT